MKFDSIIFDMDGVLVDESKSYRRAIEMTVNMVLAKNEIKTTADQEDIQLIKRIPRFNNDWDVSFVLIELIEKGVSRKNYENLVKPVTNKIRKTTKYQKIKEIFQSYYLGKKLFLEIYKRPPPLSNLRGLNLEDSLLIEMSLLSSLSIKYKLGIATSRPRLEALFTAKNLMVTPNIFKENYIVAKEDARKEKPEPDPLLEVMKRMDINSSIYIGDTINDVIAAKKAGIPCVFIGDNKLGNYQFNNVNKIKELFL